MQKTLFTEEKGINNHIINAHSSAGLTDLTPPAVFRIRFVSNNFTIISHDYKLVKYFSDFFRIYLFSLSSLAALSIIAHSSLFFSS